MKFLQRFFTLLALVLGAVAAGRFVLNLVDRRAATNGVEGLEKNAVSVIGGADGPTAVYVAWRGGRPHLPAALAAGSAALALGLGLFARKTP